MSFAAEDLAAHEAAELQALYRIGNAPLQPYPFSHFYARDVFPPAFYSELQGNLPPPRAMPSLEESRGVKGYPERFVLPLRPEPVAALPRAQGEFWAALARWMLGGRFGRMVLQKFAPVVGRRLQELPEGTEVTDELLLVCDRTRYALGPHTDSPAKLVSLLFYLPADERLARHGTSLYLPKDPDFVCPGGPHHAFEGFDRAATMPFLPNSVFGFPKTPTSFHGVEPIDAPEATRYLLLYDLRLSRQPPLPV